MDLSYTDEFKTNAVKQERDEATSPKERNVWG